MNKQPCKCPAYPFPHRLFSGDCYGEQAEYGKYYADEYADERRLDERERSKYINAILRGAAK